MDRPIIYQTYGIQGILDGLKTMTRRVIKPQPELGKPWKHWTIDYEEMDLPTGLCRYGVIGDRLWVREKHILDSNSSRAIFSDGAELFKTGEYVEDFCNTAGVKWRSPIHMPKWVSRIWLEVVDIKVERVFDITEEDARKEGFANRGDFLYYWNQMYKKTKFTTNFNPWVWVIEFKVLSTNGEPK